MRSRGILLCTLVLFLGEAGAAPPNVVVMLADDQGWGDLSVSGNTDIATPHIDSLAENGARFDRFYVCPVCSPTRAEFLTGRYHARSGVYSTSAGGERMDLDEKTIAEVFKDGGYATAAFGKWHNGMQYPYHPTGRGFDEFYGFCSGHWGHYFSPMLEHNGRIVRGEGYITNDLTDRAVSFIKKNRARPFFLYLAFNTPHSPMQVPDRWWNKFKDKKLEKHNRDPRKENPLHKKAALAMCENIDWNVGRVLEALEEHELSGNTIVVYFSDNGPNGWRWNGGMRGRKGSTDEGGVRSPFFIRWPAGIKPGMVVKEYGGAIDLLPTLADLAGVKASGTKPLDGISFKKRLCEEKTPAAAEDRIYFSCWRDRVSARWGPYRMDHRGRLYDLMTDPGQDVNIAAKKPDIQKRLSKAVALWRKNVLAERDQPKRPFIIGHSGFHLFQLPARDAEATGAIKRSNRFPNCSYFTSWTRVEDVITWDAVCMAGGRYKAEVYYSCPADDVGAVVQLSFNGETVERKLTESNDPALKGAAHDRVKRMESYVKEFTPFSLGTITLKKGRGTLTLRALENAKGQVMEFRLLMLTRLN